MDKVVALLADDHALVRAGIRNALAKFPNLEIAAEAADGPSLFDLLGRTDPDLLLIDVAMPGFDPLGTIRRIRAQHPRMRILVISAYDDNVYVDGLLSAGVDGYHLKGDSLNDLQFAVECVLAGERWVSSSLVTRLTQGRAAGPASRTLTTRQVELLQLLQQGLDNQSIAHRLGLSVKTVENHLTRLYRQIGVQSRLEALSYLQQHAELAGPPLPPPPPASVADAGPPGGAVRSDGVTILLVDDNVRYRRQMRLMIARVQPAATVWEAQDTANALGEARRARPQLVFVDVILGEENGIHCVRRLKTLLPGAQIVLISAYPDREFHRLGLEAGAVAFVDKKDLDAATLRQIIDNVTV
jgi:DNA-binding NarL/FixJ family response regulator